ncbi:MAG: sigma-70 family RNA polymerase sigma factor [Chitinophagaceae bacterium]
METCVACPEVLNLPDAAVSNNAFAELYEKYYQQLLFFAVKCLGTTEGAPDVVQDCFIKLWQLRKGLNQILSIRNYLYTMVRNRCTDLLYNKSRASKLEEEWQHCQESALIVSEFAEIDGDILPEILSAMKKLPPRMQEVFRLYYLEGKSYAEISALLNT